MLPESLSEQDVVRASRLTRTMERDDLQPLSNNAERVEHFDGFFFITSDLCVVGLKEREETSDVTLESHRLLF